MTTDLFIGVDIGGTRTKYGLVNIGAGEVLQNIVQPTEKKNGELFLQQIEKVINECKALATQQQSRLTGIGIGVPGFTTENGIVLTTYGFLEFMENYPLKELVEQAFSIRCLIENDARIVALGEAAYGKGKGYKRVLVLTLGTGVGFGFVVNGKFTDTVPLSHMGGNLTITDEGGECYCGKKGCLEALVSSTGIINLAKQHGFTGEPSAEAVFAAALLGSTEALAVVNRVIYYLHTAIHNYVNLFAPDIIVLGGGIAKGLRPYLEKIKGRMYMGPYPGYDFQLAVSELEELAGMLGSAALFQSSFKQTA